jgi:hypothetical protein
VFQTSTANSSYSDASGAEKRDVRATCNKLSDCPEADLFLQELDTSTAILKKKKKPNSLM